MDFIQTFLVAFTFILVGLCLGSFASAITYRITSHKSWIFDDKVSKKGDRKPARSFCPSCHHQLSVLDLIPLMSWVLLRGKCRYCHVKIPVKYPLIELLGGMFMYVAFKVELTELMIVLYIMTLPFLLTFLLLFILRFKAPLYVYALSVSNVLVLIVADMWK